MKPPGRPFFSKPQLTRVLLPDTLQPAGEGEATCSAIFPSHLSEPLPASSCRPLITRAAHRILNKICRMLYSLRCWFLQHQNNEKVIFLFIFSGVRVPERLQSHDPAASLALGRSCHSPGVPALFFEAVVPACQVHRFLKELSAPG